jgi:hypothetical protein
MRGTDSWVVISLHLRLLGCCAADLLVEDGRAPGGFKLGHLAGEALGVRRDAGIVVNHTRIVHQKYASEMPNQISALGLVQIS